MAARRPNAPKVAGSSPAPATKAEAIELRRRGASYETIAERTGVDAAAARAFVAQAHAATVDDDPEVWRRLDIERSESVRATLLANARNADPVSASAWLAFTRWEQAERDRLRDQPPPSSAIADAAATGDRQKVLEALRDRLAHACDVAPDTVVAQVAARLTAVVAELAEITKGTSTDFLDELQARRESRGVPAPPRRETRQRRPS